MISGSLEIGGSTIEIENGNLRGDQISFSADGDEYTGRVNANKIEGTVTSKENNRKWSAILIPD